MNQSSDQPRPAAEPSGPYERLGVAPDASFDEVQAARQARLEEVGDDTMARSRIEAAYDAVLMERLKERQQGKVSSAAQTASQREQQKTAAAAPSMRQLPAMPSLPQLPKGLAMPAVGMPSLELATDRELWVPLAVGVGLLGLLMLAPSASPELLLALATLGCVVALQRRRRRLLAAVGWGVGLLSLGLVVGGLLVALVGPTLSAGLPLGMPLTLLQLQALPPLLLLLLGALLLA